MTDVKQEYGWYMADGGSYGGNGADPWQLIEEAVASEADLARDHDREPQWDEIMIGPVKDALPSEYLDDDDIDVAAFSVVGATASEAAVEAGRVADAIDERYAGAVHDGRARIGALSGEALASAVTRALKRSHAQGLCPKEERASVVNAVRAWADQHIELDPDRIVEGDHALPVMRIRGEWVYGRHGTPEGLEATVMPELVGGEDGGETRVVWSARVVGFDEGSWIEAEDLVEAKRAADVALASAEVE